MKKLFFTCFVIAMFSCNSSHYIYIVRHTEKQDSTITSVLSANGRLQSLALKDRLLNKKIDAIFVTTIHAPQETAEPLAEAINQKPHIYSYNALDSLVNILKGMKNKNIVVVDHRGTIPVLIEKLTGNKVETPDIRAYDNIWIIRNRKGAKTLTQEKY
jgi:2,3-bisphosphoglycerate-dependent phosphoglycerate mutase